MPIYRKFISLSSPAMFKQRLLNGFSQLGQFASRQELAAYLDVNYYRVRDALQEIDLTGVNIDLTEQKRPHVFLLTPKQSLLLREMENQGGWTSARKLAKAAGISESDVYRRLQKIDWTSLNSARKQAGFGQLFLISPRLLRVWNRFYKAFELCLGRMSLEEACYLLKNYSSYSAVQAGIHRFNLDDWNHNRRVNGEFPFMPPIFARTKIRQDKALHHLQSLGGITTLSELGEKTGLMLPSLREILNAIDWKVLNEIRANFNLFPLRIVNLKKDISRAKRAQIRRELRKLPTSLRAAIKDTVDLSIEFEHASVPSKKKDKHFNLFYIHVLPALIELVAGTLADEIARIEVEPRENYIPFETFPKLATLMKLIEWCVQQGRDLQKFDLLHYYRVALPRAIQAIKQENSEVSDICRVEAFILASLKGQAIVKNSPIRYESNILRLARLSSPD